MFFEARIGDRFESQGLDVVWIPRGADSTQGPDTKWIKALRGGTRERDVLQRERAGKRRRSKRKDLNGRLYNVSVSGAGVVAESNDRCSVGSGVTVELEAGNYFDARIRRIEEVEESGSAYYGLEYIFVSDEYKAWLHEVHIAHRGLHAMTPATMLDHGGLRAGAERSEREAEEFSTGRARTEPDEEELARRHRRCRELATAFLPDPVFEVSADGSRVQLPYRIADTTEDPDRPYDLPYHEDAATPPAGMPADVGSDNGADPGVETAPDAADDTPATSVTDPRGGASRRRRRASATKSTGESVGG